MILQEERERAAVDRQNLISQIAALINSTADDQDKRLTKRVELVQSEMATAKEDLVGAAKQYNTGMDDWVGEEEKLIAGLVDSQESLGRMLVNDWQVRVFWLP